MGLLYAEFIYNHGSMRVLLIGPYDAQGKKIQESIRRSLSGPDIQVITSDSLLSNPGAIGAEMMSDAIESADLIIADVSRENPNVFYELGLAHGLRKPTILLANSRINPRIPSDLDHTFYVSYDPDDLPTLNSYVRHSVKSYAGKKR